MARVKWNANFNHCPACGSVCHNSEYDKAVKAVNGEELRSLREAVAALKVQLADALRPKETSAKLHRK
tara:strand:- start:1420 stop:1623 length:204 start_codon:yes stop_codon:yes gene_type:complete